MRLMHRPIDPKADRDYVLERHCRVNYACDCPWKRALPYADYRREWLGWPGQVQGFWDALTGSMQDPRSIAEVIEDESGAVVAYLWAPFYEDAESGFLYVDIQDLYVEPAFRRRGVAADLMAYVAARAQESGARAIRSGTGCFNEPSMALHRKLGFYAYRVEYEKLL